MSKQQQQQQQQRPKQQTKVNHPQHALNQHPYSPSSPPLSVSSSSSSSSPSSPPIPSPTADDEYEEEEDGDEREQREEEEEERRQDVEDREGNDVTSPLSSSTSHSSTFSLRHRGVEQEKKKKTKENEQQQQQLHPQLQTNQHATQKEKERKGNKHRPPRSSSSSPSPPSSSLLPPLRFFLSSFVYSLWKVIQTLICICSFFLCGGLFCGNCCCVPCRNQHSTHRRRRRRSGVPYKHHSSRDSSPHDDIAASSPAASPSSSSSRKMNEYESWTEEDDSEFEYEKYHSPSFCSCASSRLCQFFVLLLILLLGYLVLFVRVMPGPASHPNQLDVEFGFNDFLPPIGVGVPIPPGLHSSIQSIMGPSGERPGMIARKDGLEAHFPIVFVPGIVSTALEVWEGEPCAKQHFRQRLWGSALMLRSILLDSRCWLRHLSLDGWSGMDPEGIKLRPASGLEASDYLVYGFWIWAKLIENFADVGYDVNSMFMAPYDWRLSMQHLQIRDYYFTKLKYTIEIAKLSNHNRLGEERERGRGDRYPGTSEFLLRVLMPLLWVTSAKGGCGGSDWVANHIESTVNIGVPFLGVPKVFAALFSGEMKDTAELAPFLDYWRQRVVFSQSDVLNIMRSFRSMPSMFPKGGECCSAPDDEEEEEGEDREEIGPEQEDVKRVAVVPRHSLGQLLSFTSPIAFPFPNITALVEEIQREYKEGKINQDGMEQAMRNVRENSSTPSSSKEGGGRSMTDFSVERAAQLWKMIAWSDVEFNEQLFSQGYGQKSDEEEEEEEAAEGEEKDVPPTPTQSSRSSSLLDIDPSSSSNVLDDPRFWVNPLETSLPAAPHMKIFCLYGVGKETERGYVYGKASEIPALPRITDLLQTRAQKTEMMQGTVPTTSTTPAPGVGEEGDEKERLKEGKGDNAVGAETTDKSLPPCSSSTSSSSSPSSPCPPHIGARSPTLPLFALNTSFHHPDAHIRHGVKLSDGDGTAPLVSLGYMCVDGWKQKRWNPSRMKVITREYVEVNQTLPILRSTTSVDHVDIMGNNEMIKDLLYITSIRSSSGDSKPPSSASSSSSSSSSSASSSPLSSPLGHLTWSEVTDRIYSRIVRISERLHERWEKRTGHKLERSVRQTEKKDTESTSSSSSSGAAVLTVNAQERAKREEEEAVEALLARAAEARSAAKISHDNSMGRN